ncbi:MAG: MBL fold metallo-hydrolase [Lachnospiraceae bacterium]|nr:MBL fold metallo-hydrolase [Lachnospiraceae bacterium]MBQ9390598.1 MBL fold metallo-hydrolase [Lachnospiraceae bacterium]
MSKMELIQYVVGPVCTNCYFVINSDTKETIIIDPGDEAEHLIDRIEIKELKPVAILLTHGHFDHVGAAGRISDEYSIPVYASRNERNTLRDPLINHSGVNGRIPAIYHASDLLDDEDVLELAGFTIKVFYTPGHTPGGVCYYLPDEKCVFSGDTLFYNSVGRTDFVKSSSEDLINSIKTKLMTLDDDIIVLPGHDARTTIGEERMHNPFL